MRIARGSLGALADFVGGSFVVPENPVMRGQGVGDFVAGRFVVPQTPVGMSGRRGVGDFAPGAFSVPQTPVGMGYLLDNAPLYAITPNSVIADYNANGIQYAGGLTGLGCGGGCSSSCGKCGMSGRRGMSGTGMLSADWSQLIADLSEGNISSALTADLPAVLQDPLVAGIPVWAVVAGGVLILYLGGTKKRWR
jgi:hypothetical protein